MSWKTSLWIRSKMQRLFLNTLTVDNMYSPHSWEKLSQPVQTQLSLKPKTNSESFIAFYILITFCILKKSMSLTPQIFWKLLTPKNVLPWMPKSSCFRTPFGSQSVRVSQTLVKSARNRFYPIFPLIQDKLSRKFSLSIWSKI